MSLWSVVSVNTGEHIIIWWHFDGCVWTLDTPASLSLSLNTGAGCCAALQQRRVLIATNPFSFQLLWRTGTLDEEKAVKRKQNESGNTSLPLFPVSCVFSLSVCLSLHFLIKARTPSVWVSQLLYGPTFNPHPLWPFLYSATPLFLLPPPSSCFLVIVPDCLSCLSNHVQTESGGYGD